MTDEMLNLVRANANRAGAENVEFVEGEIEQIPLPDASIDVVISNCSDQPVDRQTRGAGRDVRVLAPAGRIGISDVVAEDHLTSAEHAGPWL